MPKTHAASQGAGQILPGNLWEIVGCVQTAHSFFPAAAINQVIPIGNDVVDWTARVAERYSAIHAAGSLLLLLFLWKRAVDFHPVVDTFYDGTPLRQLARKLHESSRFTHVAPARRWSIEGVLRIGTACSPRSRSTRLYSCGNTLINFDRLSLQLSRIQPARGLPVKSRCRVMSSWRSSISCSSVTGSRSH